MLEIRIHGRGGQGAVIASKVLAAAFFREGRWAQGFPAFGVERRGAPVAAFVRVDDRPIDLRCEIYEPNLIVVLDHTLLRVVDVSAGLRAGGLILVNAPHDLASETFPRQFSIATVDATGIALRYGLGTRGAPIVNSPILGAFARAFGLLGIDAVLATIREYMPGSEAANVGAAEEAFAAVRLPAVVD